MYYMLGYRFVWRKKIEKDVAQGVGLDMFSVKAEKKRQKERMVCILATIAGNYLFL